MKKILYTIIVAVALTLASSCTHKELCYDHSHTVDMQVIFDWQYSSGANPASMAVFLFSHEGGEPLRYDFTEHEGGEIRIAIGSYDALCINSDTENISYRNTEQAATFQVTTPNASLLSGLASLGVRSDNAPRANGSDDERVALAPDAIWCDHKEDIMLEETAEIHTTTLYPVSEVCHYTVEITNAENLKYTNGMSGAVSGLSGGKLIYSGLPTGECVTVPFETTVLSDNTTVTGDFLTFGDIPDDPKTHSLTIYAVLADNSKWYYTYDVTGQINSAPDPQNVHIVLDGLPLPKPIVNGGGFKPEVDEWNTVDVDIEM
jgi:hypothetical protein